MSTRRIKQFIYGTFYLIVWGVLLTGGYFLAKVFFPGAPATPACVSGCMPSGADAIATSSVTAFVSGPGRYTFLAQITNTSPDYAAQYFDYSIDLYDASGTVIQSVPGTSFAYASEQKYLVVPNVAVPDAFAGAGLALRNAYWTPSSTLGVPPRFSTENVTSAGTSSTVSVSGQLTNANIATFRYVFVTVIFRGADGAPNAASQTELDNVAPNKLVNFSVLYPQTGAINPANYQVLVYGLK